MSAQTIQSQDISVGKIFGDFYAVPDYQREYVWEAEQVEQLMSDIRSEMGDKAALETPEYFIGSVVVCRGCEGLYDLIDGQQRMTTLFLTLCGIRDHLNEIGATPPGALQPQIAAIATDELGRDHSRFRLDLQYEDSGDALVRIAQGETNWEPTNPTRSIRNIRNAYAEIRDFLRSEFGNDPDATRAFYGYLTNRVKLIRIETEDVAKALKVFETINDRGVGLDSMDLLKNLLFMKADRSRFESLKTVWKQLQDTIFKAKEKPLRFLRYYIVANHKVEVLREDEIYGWFVRNEPACGYASNPLRFAKELVEAADAYQHFLQGEDRHGRPNRHLKNISALAGQAARQHLVLLLAGRHLADDLFEILCREVENLFFCYVITREHTRNFERAFAVWADSLRQVRSLSELELFVDQRFRKTKRDLSLRFDDAFNRLSANAIQKYRLRYVLGKITQYVDMNGFGENDATIWLARYMAGGNDIEHILPANPSESALNEFGEGDLDALTPMLGNLVLAEESINRSLGNRPYSEKRPVYAKSQYLLTRSLAERVSIGTATRIDRAVAELEYFEAWNADAVQRRQAQLARLARQVWDVPSDKTGRETADGDRSPY